MQLGLLLLIGGLGSTADRSQRSDFLIAAQGYRN